MGKIIRFFSTLKPDQPMDMLTIEDLKAEGFVQYRYVNRNHIHTRGEFETIESQQYLVHESIPVDSRHKGNADIPYIEWVPGNGYEARWGGDDLPPEE